jgi:ABC-type sugar transport system ATPase subunit
MITRLAIRGHAAQPMQTLSGGNQQKGLLARWMLTQARVFLLDEPTRGIDVNAKEEVFALMEELASQRAAILMVSSEIPELLRMCDRLLVMRDNRIVRELIPGTTSREEVLQWAL